MKNLVARKTLIATITILLVAGFFVTNIISYQAAKLTVRDNIIHTSLPLTRDNIYSEIQKDIMHPVYVASLMANDTFLRDWVIDGEKDYSSIEKYLLQIKKEYGFFISFFVSENTKSYYYNDGMLKTLSREDEHDKWYYNFIDKHVPYELTVDTSEAENYKLTIFINHRVYDYSHNLIGVTGVGLDLERITNLLAAYRVKYNRDIYLVDKNGIIKAHHDPKLVEIANIKLMQGIGEHADEILTIGQQSEDFEFDTGDSHILLTKRYIPELDWFLIVEQNQNKALATIWANFLKTTMLGLIVSAAVLFIIISAINYYNRRLEKMAVTDELTGIYNRREFLHIFDQAVSGHRKTGSAFSVLLIDIDNFKNINDVKGHHVGDQVLKAVTEVCSENVREKDTMTRWGGDEFIALVYGDSEAAEYIAKRIQASLLKDEDLKELLQGEMSLTLSIGIAQYTPEDTAESITIRADRALYEAKNAGRNRYVVA